MFNKVLFNSAEIRNAITDCVLQCKSGIITTYSIAMNRWVDSVLRNSRGPLDIHISGPIDVDTLHDITEYNNGVKHHNFYRIFGSHSKSYIFVKEDNKHVAIITSMNFVYTNWYETGFIFSGNNATSLYNDVQSRIASRISLKDEFNVPDNVVGATSGTESEYDMVITDMASKVDRDLINGIKFRADLVWDKLKPNDRLFISSIISNFLERGISLSDKQKYRMLSILKV